MFDAQLAFNECLFLTSITRSLVPLFLLSWATPVAQTPLYCSFCYTSTLHPHEILMDIVTLRFIMCEPAMPCTLGQELVYRPH